MTYCRAIQERRLRANADRLRFIPAGDFDGGENRRQSADGKIQVRRAIADVAPERDGDDDQRVNSPIHQLTNSPTYSIHLVGSTSPMAGPSCSARLPSKSVRPARACSKKRFCSSVSPRITRSM